MPGHCEPCPEKTQTGRRLIPAPTSPETTPGWARPASKERSASMRSRCEPATTPRRPRPKERRRASVWAMSRSGTAAPSSSSQVARRRAAAGSTPGDPAGTRKTSDGPKRRTRACGRSAADARRGIPQARGTGCAVRCGACSSTTWALVPENPKEETAARRDAAWVGQPVSSVGTNRRVPSAWIAGFQRLKCRLGGMSPCWRQSTALIRPTTPAAGSRCPRFVLTDPSAQRPWPTP